MLKNNDDDDDFIECRSMLTIFSYASLTPI